MRYLSTKQIQEIIRTDIRFFWWITLRIMSRVCLLQDINVSHTEKIFLPDISLRNRLCRVC